MTAHATKSDRDRCLAAGMDGYLSKPVDTRELIGLVESLACGDSPSRSRSRQRPARRKPRRGQRRWSSILKKPFRGVSTADMVREMIQCFHGEVDNLFPQMRAALAKGDLEEVGRLGHRMKGTVVYLGPSNPLRPPPMRLERFCQPNGGMPSEAEDAVNALERECSALKAALIQHPLAAEPK